MRKPVGSILLTSLALAGFAAGSAARADDTCAVNPEVRLGQISKAGGEKVKIKADEIDFPGRNVVLLRGYTQLVRGGHRVSADELLYDKVKNEVTARGVVKFESPSGDVVETSVLHYDVATGVAVSGPAAFVIANRTTKVLGSGHSTVNAHGVADRVTYVDENTMLLENAEVTTCLDGAKDITFKADELKVDLNKGVQTGKRVKIQIAEPEKHRRLREKISIN